MRGTTREAGGRRKNSGRAAPSGQAKGRGGVASYGALGRGEVQGTAVVWLPRRRRRVAAGARRIRRRGTSPPQRHGVIETDHPSPAPPSIQSN